MEDTVENQFILSCCSTVDLLYAYMEGRHIPFLFHTCPQTSLVNVAP